MARRALIVIDPTVEEGAYEVGGTLILPGDTPLEAVGFAATARIVRVRNKFMATELRDTLELRHTETLIYEAP